VKHAVTLASGALALGLVLPGPAVAATGPQIWAQAGCGGCHTLRAAGSHGDGGPDLDSLRPSAAAVAAQVASGGSGMPSFAGSLSSSAIQALASWVSASAGGVVSASGPAATPGGTTAAGSLGTAAIRRIQRTLATLSYFKGPVTGFYGPLTTAAVKAFQQASGLAADGIWGPRTQAALAAARSGTRHGTSARHASGLSAAAVRNLQAELLRLGYFGGPVTGFYGPLTTAAVKRFQRAQGLKVDGIWGPHSAAALRRRLG
jgi:peptidoglycan hydrolase-like protein with peptidoglycan-binding domain